MVLPSRAVGACRHAQQSEGDDHQTNESSRLEQVQSERDRGCRPSNRIDKRDQTPARPIRGIGPRLSCEDKPHDYVGQRGERLVRTCCRLARTGLLPVSHPHLNKVSLKPVAAQTDHEPSETAAP